MQFDPDVQRHLDAMKVAPPPHMPTDDPARARQLYREAAHHDGGARVEMAEVRDFTTSGRAGAILLRLYRPEGVEDCAAPAVIFIHGGGFVLGDLDSHDGLCRRLAAATQCKVVAATYRLAPEHPAPAAAEDVAAALHGIVAQADALGIDVRRLAVAGDSAGGCLTAVAAMMARDSGMALRCQVLAYPSIDNREHPPLYPSREANRGVPPLLPETLGWATRSYLPDRQLGDDWRQSPILGELAGVAPAMVVVAERDPLRSEGLAYADALEAAGVEVTRRLVPGMVHGFLTKSGVFAATDKVIAAIAAELRHRLDIAAA